MQLIDFQEKCNAKLCLRKTFTDFDTKGKCFTHSKQSNCYTKYLKQLEKDQESRTKRIEELKNAEITIDQKWIETREKVLNRDKSCRVWQSLSMPQRVYVLEHYSDDYNYLSKILDVDHIIPKSVRFDLYYELDNLLLMSRYFHRLLTDYKHPVTRKKITDEEKKIIYEKIKNYKMI